MNPDHLVCNVNPRVQSVKEQMNHFLGLLQKSISSSRDNILIETDSQYSNSQCSRQSKKLSVILSASEGASSQQQGRKEQNHYDEVSMNEFGSSSLEDNFIRPLIRKKTEEMFQECTPSTTGKLNEFDQSMLFIKNNKGELFLEECSRVLDKKNEQQLLDYFKSIIRDYTNYISVLERRNNENLLKKQKYRTKCEHLFRAFVTGREEQKRLQESYIEQKDKIDKLESLKGEFQLRWLKTTKQLEVSRSQTIYLKQLIMIANKNYQSLEKKYLQSEERFKYSEMAMKQKEMQFIQGNSVLKDVIFNLQKDRKAKSKEKSREKEQKESKELKQNKENRHLNKHKTSKSVPPQQKGGAQEAAGKKQQLDDAYRRMFLKTLRGG